DAVLESMPGWHYHERYDGLQVPPVEVRFSDDPKDAAGLPQSRPHPVYPSRAASRGESGSVTVQFCIDGQGKPIAPSVIESTPRGVFDQAALDAVKKWRYHPVPGEAHHCLMPVKLDFRL
ncbi:MAG: energy transducer TonB, partial [Myxococcota bacterium]